MRKKQIQIDEDLFILLCRYFLGGVTDLQIQITGGIQTKLDKIALHDLYSKSKESITDDLKEKYRQDYLEAKGIPVKYRW